MCRRLISVQTIGFGFGAQVGPQHAASWVLSRTVDEENVKRSAPCPVTFAAHGLFHTVWKSTEVPGAPAVDANCKEVPGTHTYPLPGPIYKHVPRRHSLMLALMFLIFTSSSGG